MPGFVSVLGYVLGAQSYPDTRHCLQASKSTSSPKDLKVKIVGEHSGSIGDTPLCILEGIRDLYEHCKLENKSTCS